MKQAPEADALWETGETGDIGEIWDTGLTGSTVSEISKTKSYNLKKKWADRAD